MSTHLNRKSSKSPSSLWETVVYSSLFVGGVTAGAMLLFKAMRLQSEQHLDEISAVRQQHDRLEMQFQNLTAKISQLDAVIENVSTSQASKAPVASLQKTAARRPGTPKAKAGGSRTSANRTGKSDETDLAPEKSRTRKTRTIENDAASVDAPSADSALGANTSLSDAANEPK